MTCFKCAFRCSVELIPWDSYKFHTGGEIKKHRRKWVFFMYSKKSFREMIKGGHQAEKREEQTDKSSYKTQNLIKRLPRPLQNSLSKDVTEREMFPSAELGLRDQHTHYDLLLCSVKSNTVLTLYFEVFLKQKYIIHQTTTHRLHPTCMVKETCMCKNMKYWYMYAKCKNQNCSHINN